MISGRRLMVGRRLISGTRWMVGRRRLMVGRGWMAGWRLISGRRWMVGRRSLIVGRRLNYETGYQILKLSTNCILKWWFPSSANRLDRTIDPPPIAFPPK